MWRAPVVCLCLFVASSAGQAWADAARFEQIIERWENANRWRHHVLVVAHRAGWLESGEPVRPENSLAALEHSVALGVEMVELDIRASADGELVVMHDSWLDRTTTCRGEVVRLPLARLKQCRLIVEGGSATDEPVPTLREMLLAARGRILVNVDNKLGVEAVPAIAELAADLGMADQVVVKENLWNERRIALVQNTLKQARPIRFMPVMADDAVREAAFVEHAARTFEVDAVEMIAWWNEESRLTPDGGPLFSTDVRDAARRGGWHIWVNLFGIVNMPGGPLAGGRGDALAAVSPGEAYGFWIERGVTVIQTDEPEATLRWLEENGFRAPYGLTN